MLSNLTFQDSNEVNISTQSLLTLVIGLGKKDLDRKHLSYNKFL